MNLQEFINKNKDLANQYLKCGACDNQLLHCGKYEIVKVGVGKGKKSEEGLLCETCKKIDRKLINAIKISDDNNHIFRFALSQLVTTGEEEEIVPPTPNTKGETIAISKKEEEKVSK